MLDWKRKQSILFHVENQFFISFIFSHFSTFEMDYARDANRVIDTHDGKIECYWIHKNVDDIIRNAVCGCWNVIPFIDKKRIILATEWNGFERRNEKWEWFLIRQSGWILFTSVSVIRELIKLQWIFSWYQMIRIICESKVHCLS